LVLLESMAGTGETIEYVRPRVAPKVVLLRFDQKGDFVEYFSYS